MAQTPNLVTPQKGLVSTTPFQGSLKPITPVNGAYSYQNNISSTNPFLNGSSGQPGLISPQLTSTPATPAPKVSSAGVQNPIGTSVTIASSNTPLQSQQTSYTLNGVNYNANGTPITTTLPSSNQTTNSGGQSTYQQNLSNYGLTSIPQGYSFNASGKLVNGSGQEYVSPSTSQENAGANTYNGGVNTNGQTLSGYVPTPQSQLGSAISTLGNTASSPSSTYTQNQNNSSTAQSGLIANSDITPTEQNILNQENSLGQSFNISNTDTTALEPGLTIGQVSGQQGALLNAYNTGLQNLQTQEGQAQTQQGIQQTGLNEAGGLANTGASNATAQQGTQQSGQGAVVGALAPASQYGALTNPVTGEAISGGSSGSVLPQSAQTLVNTLAQQVQNGQMTQSQALSELTTYGPAGISALTQALGPSFSTNNSNNSAATTQAGQALQTQASSANQSLSTLQNLYQSLPGFSTTGIPGLNGLTNSIESYLGSSNLSSYNAALTDARTQLEGVLAAAGGGTPTGYESAAMSYLPDNMTPSQLAANINTVQQLIQQKVSSFQSSGQSSGSTTGITNYNF